MESNLKPGPTVLVIFGAGGDLTNRKLVPALYNLFLDGWLPEQFAVLGVDRLAMSDDQFRQHLRGGVDSFSRQGKSTDEQWGQFAPRLSYLQADLTDGRAYAAIGERLAARDKEWGAPAIRLFYLAVGPSLIETIVGHSSKAGLTADRGRARVVVEKPFGRDLTSATLLDRSLTGMLKESQIYRIDHYLGKETVQNLFAFRFANSIFEPIWNRRYVDHVQITVAETVGVERRGGYYDHAGAVRDMIQNHLLQVLCLIAMEPPVSFAADEVRNKKVDVLRAVRPIVPHDLPKVAVRGQYGPGLVNGKPVVGYRQEPMVDPHSSTETFAALQLWVDNWRWQDVPFYLRTGKRLAARVSEVVIQFRPVPHRSFPPMATDEWSPNRLKVRIQPEEGIALSFQAKYPGLLMRLRPVDLNFSYREAFHDEGPEAYETLLLDAMRGDATLFMRADQVEAAWSIVQPILDGWAATPPANFPNYTAGSWGPGASDALLARDGRLWVPPNVDARIEEPET